eukprot:CAMPEP_0175991858 /NCGR_PEP_ID=MMETSP0108-20121206/53071_1 /TAXON_ID=195067 ORGANISM="Goniomonas pacifica, Strain CCMP1869" /NCGR_SAMPLE_ID=MMETSP0108 /ASSEMBLY_ACC=CAM_ASM_000204 /LENGTH=67 /DNA_ID=CAMNT_0017323439 /DNA_START=1 /DNA_END=200 /DNA_ORIENTATION=-
MQHMARIGVGLPDPPNAHGGEDPDNLVPVDERVLLKRYSNAEHALLNAKYQAAANLFTDAATRDKQG